MQKMNYFWTIVIVLFFAGSLYGKDVDDKALSACMNEKNNFKRLMCYDRLFQPHDSQKPVFDEQGSMVKRLVRLGQKDELGFFNYVESSAGIDSYFVGRFDQSGDYCLLISCLSNITRFQLFSLKGSFPDLFEDIEVRSHGRLLFESRWQRLEDEQVLDIGRGQYAITNIKKMIASDSDIQFIIKGKQIIFSLAGLGQRTCKMDKACGWR